MAPSTRLARLQYVLVLAFLVLFLIVGWRTRTPLYIRGSDDLIYLSLSHSLESGSYRETYLVGAPAHWKYPPGYPAWLIPVRHLVGESIEGIKLTNLLLAAAALLLAYGVARRLLGSWLAVGLVFLLATTPVLMATSSTMMSDSLFLFLSTAALVAAFSADQSGKSALPAIAMGWLALLTRLAGITLVAALGLWVWRRRRRKELVAYLLVWAVAVAGGLLYLGLSRGLSRRSYGTDLGTLTGGGLVRTLGRTWRTAVSYGTGELPSTLSLPTVAGTIADNLFWLGTLLVLLSVGLVLLWRRWPAAAFALVLYGALLLAWYPMARLLVSVLPLILLVVLLGAEQLANRLPVRARAPALGAFVAVLSLGTIRGTLNLDQQRRGCDRSDPLHSEGCYVPEIRSLISGIEYVGAHTNPQDIIMTSDPATVNYLTGRLTVSSSEVRDAPPGKAADRLRELNVRFALLSAVRPLERGPVAQALLASCRDFVIAARFDPYVLVLSPTLREGDPDACEPLARFIQETNVKYQNRDP